MIVNDVISQMSFYLDQDMPLLDIYQKKFRILSGALITDHISFFDVDYFGEFNKIYYKLLIRSLSNFLFLYIFLFGNVEPQNKLLFFLKTTIYNIRVSNIDLLLSKHPQTKKWGSAPSSSLRPPSLPNSIINTIRSLASL